MISFQRRRSRRPKNRLYPLTIYDRNNLRTMSQRTTCVCSFEHNIIFQILDILVGSLTATVAVQIYIGGQASFSPSFFFGVYLLTLGVSIGLIALCIPGCVVRYFRFILTFLGRALLYICLGFLTYSPPSGYTTGFVCSIFCWLTGFIYLVLTFVRGCGNPRPCCILQSDGHGGCCRQTTKMNTYSSY